MSDERPVEDVRVDPDGLARLELEVPAGSGYRWEVSARPPGIRIEDRRVQPATAFGGSAVEVLSVSLSSDEPGDLVLVLKRPWEEVAVETRRYRILFDK